MVTPILTTKLYIPPPRPDLVPRPYLVQKLNEGVRSKLTLISAPAGFGKSTLLSDWVAKSALSATWLSLDTEDNQVIRFLTCFITALQRINHQIAQEALETLQSARTPNYKVILSNLINEIAETKEHFALILDDYHVITEAQIHDCVLFLIYNLPLPMHLMIATRSDPPFPISRLRVRGQLTEIRQADLRFTPEETANYFNEILSLNLRQDQVKVLERRTEGWIAGLHLASLSIQGNSDRENFIHKFGGSHKFVFDYLVEEVFDRQTEDLQQFLCQTSILDYFNSSLCNAVSNGEDSDRLIRELETANLFLLPLDDQREWYRYHHLFQDFLRIRLDKKDLPDLHLKAVKWLMANGYILEAVKHALASGVTEITVQVITKAAVVAFNQAAFQTVLGWLDALPEEVVRSHAELAVIKGVIYFLLHSAEEARPYVEAVGSSKLQDVPDSTQGQYLYSKALLAFCDNQLGLCIEYAKKALAYLGDDQQVLRALAMNLLGEVLDVEGDIESAVEYYQQAFDTGWRSGDRVGALVLFTNLILTLNELGRRCEAEDWCRQLAERITAQSPPGSSLLDAIYLPWSLLKYEANQLDLAREFAHKALRLLEVVNFPQGIIWGQYFLALIYLAEGKLDQLREVSNEGQKLAAKMGMDAERSSWFSALNAEADLNVGNLSVALRWAGKTGLTHLDITNRWNENVYFTYVKILIAHTRLAEAETLLKTLDGSIKPSGRNRKMIEVDILYSQLLAAQNRKQEAISRLVNAVELAAPEDYFRVFLDEGQKILPLLTQVHSTAPAFVGSLLLTLQDSANDNDEIPEGYESLTEREQEVLHMVGRGFSNREIAAGLFVSLGTVKKHLHNIFSKFDVKNRTQAVNRGKELGLLK